MCYPNLFVEARLSPWHVAWFSTWPPWIVERTSRRYVNLTCLFLFAFNVTCTCKPIFIYYLYFVIIIRRFEEDNTGDNSLAKPGLLCVLCIKHECGRILGGDAQRWPERRRFHMAHFSGRHWARSHCSWLACQIAPTPQRFSLHRFLINSTLIELTLLTYIVMYIIIFKMTTLFLLDWWKQYLKLKEITHASVEFNRR